MNSISVLAPGRINIIGEHTDYNDGLVLPATINKGTRFRITKNGTASEVNFSAKNVNQTYQFNLYNIQRHSSGWQNYVIGVVAEILKLNKSLKGFDAEFEGDVPIGSGLSSSASLECGLAYGLNQLFDLELDPWQLITLCQAAEHNYVGTKCGIMDQFASIMGRKDRVMLLDCRSLKYNYFPLDLQKFQLILLNTNVTHALANSAYNTRITECKEAVDRINKIGHNLRSLRDISLELLEKSKHVLDQNHYLRCKHVITENDRVLRASKALKENNFEELGQLMYQSHLSLKKDYEVSCEELDFLVDYTKDKDYILGSRMMGGGFGGCTINLVEKSRIADLKAQVKIAYEEKFKTEMSIYELSIEHGTACNSSSI